MKFNLIKAYFDDKSQNFRVVMLNVNVIRWFMVITVLLCITVCGKLIIYPTELSLRFSSIDKLI